MLARTLFASTLRRTSCNTKPQRGVTRVASRFNGWYKAARKKRAFRYATSNPCRVPTARYPLTSSLPAVETAGDHCLMPTASLAKLELFLQRRDAEAQRLGPYENAKTLQLTLLREGAGAHKRRWAPRFVLCRVRRELRMTLLVY